MAYLLTAVVITLTLYKDVIANRTEISYSEPRNRTNQNLTTMSLSSDFSEQWIIANVFELDGPITYSIQDYPRTVPLSMQSGFLTESPYLAYTCTRMTTTVETFRKINGEYEHYLNHRKFDSDAFNETQCADLILTKQAIDGTKLVEVGHLNARFYDQTLTYNNYATFPPFSTWKEIHQRDFLKMLTPKNRIRPNIYKYEITDYTIQKIPIQIDPNSKQIIYSPSYHRNTPCDLTMTSCTTYRGLLLLNLPRNYLSPAVKSTTRFDTCHMSRQVIFCETLNLRFQSLDMNHYHTRHMGMAKLRVTTDYKTPVDVSAFTGDSDFGTIVRGVEEAPNRRIQAVHMGF